MRVAVAGAGDLAKYMVEELLLASYEVVVISRSKKEWFDRRDVDFRATEYTVEALGKQVADCDALISTILDYSLNSATVHLALLEACKQSPRCKTYVPSEYAGNTDEYPDQPAFYAANHNPVRKALREQKHIKWTLFNLGWLTDYLVPAKSRYIKDIGDYHPVNLNTGTIKIPGTGEEQIAFTSARDGAKAVVRLLAAEEWEETTYVCGQHSTWNSVADKLAARGIKLEKSYRSKNELDADVERAASEETVFAAQYDLWSISGAGHLPEAKLRRQRESYFKGIHFRSITEVLDDAQRTPAAAV